MLYVLPSYNEDMPLAILEAMSYSVPVVSTYVGGIPSLVENGVNGILIEAGNLQQLEGAIIKLLSTKELRNKISENNYSCIKNSFGIESGMERIYTLYESLIKGK